MSEDADSIANEIASVSSKMMRTRY
eukprot:SAG11_NODE_25544_length_357_cov_1.000000_2_plen_24_part_01